LFPIIERKISLDNDRKYVGYNFFFGAKPGQAGIHSNIGKDQGEIGYKKYDTLGNPAGGDTREGKPMNTKNGKTS
jgi:hypothetical protein